MAAAIAPAVLLSSPAFAAGGTGAAAKSPVAAVTGAKAGETAKAADMSEEDLRVAVLTIMGKPDAGRAVKTAGDKALRGTADDLRHFLEVGQYQARLEDDRVAVLTIMGKPDAGRAVKTAGDKALRGTADDLRHFLEVGQYQARLEDDRVAVL
ncbi:ALF repeat-containing protein, partial [Streptomyces hiroshimensis]